LPDGSGFLYTTIILYYDVANVFHYDINTKQKTQITKLENEFARRFSISPDGQWVVYERSNTWDEYETVDIWKIKMDGSEEKLLVKNGLDPVWSK
jgi:Tol biopolymer transport system component